MKPIIILPPNVMSEADITVLRENELCVVVSEDPSKVRFLDPIPAAKQRTQIEQAAIALSRRLLNGWNAGNIFHKSTITQMYVEMLIKGTPLDQDGTTEEQEQRLFDAEKREEIRRLARAEAKAERAAKKQAAQQPKKEAR